MIENTMQVIEKTRKGKINPTYDMTFKNVEDILENSTDYVGAVLNSFVFGYAQGMRATKAEIKKQDKAVSV